MKTVFLWLEGLISGTVPLVFLVLFGIAITFKTKGFQIRNFLKSIKFALRGNKTRKGEISSFEAVCNSLAATVGTGNIAGVAAAISTGGAGAVFWMWVTAFLSMAIKAVEITVAVGCAKKDKNRCFIGPIGCTVKGKRRFGGLATAFAVTGVLTAFTTGNITQINACVSAVGGEFMADVILGFGFCAVVMLVVVGGAKKIIKFTTYILPFMAILYIVFCLGAIAKNSARLDDAFLSIFKGAFSPKAVTGGAVGSLACVVITGAQKGIFSNEAGLSTSGIAHALVKDANAQTQGLFGIFEVFVDTILICTLTALTILSSGVIIDYGKTASSALAVQSLAIVYGNFSKTALALMLCLFGVSSVLGWAVYGIRFSGYLWGEKGEKAFEIIYPLFCIVGAVMRVDFAWRLAQIFNGIMLCINLFALQSFWDDAVEILKGKDYARKNTKNTKIFKKR